MADKSTYVPADPAHHFHSMGKTCQLLGIVPGQLRVLMDGCDVVFKMMIDDVGFLNGHDLQKLSQKCQALRAEIAADVKKAESFAAN